jgi:hypothetical protein
MLFAEALEELHPAASRDGISHSALSSRFTMVAMLMPASSGLELFAKNKIFLLTPLFESHSFRFMCGPRLTRPVFLESSTMHFRDWLLGLKREGYLDQTAAARSRRRRCVVPVVGLYAELLEERTLLSGNYLSVDSVTVTPVPMSTTVSLSGSFTDMGEMDPMTMMPGPTNPSIEINWGDGNTDTATISGTDYSGQHNYAQPSSGTANYTVTVTLTDGTSAAATGTGSVGISAGTLTVESIDATMDWNSATVAGLFSDTRIGPNPSISINWGDGSTDTATISGQNYSAGPHQYPQSGTTIQYTITATLTDGALAPATAQTMFTVVAPQVTIEATDSNASEVGPDPGEFTITRMGGSFADPLTVTFTRGGTATNGTDYTAIPTTVTIPANSFSTTVTVTPITETNIEGVETVQLTLSASNDYTLGANTNATVNIRDRAAVLKLVATAGVTNIVNGSRDVTGKGLVLTQGDDVTFEAIPTDGGDFAPGEPVWTITGMGQQAGNTADVTFDTFRIPAATTVSVGTPGNPSLTAVISLVPYPVAVASTSVVTPITNALPTEYGTQYTDVLAPSTGASGDDLAAFSSSGLLKFMEHVTINSPYTYAQFNIPGPIDLPGSIYAGGIVYDSIKTPVSQIFPLGPNNIPLPNATLQTPQDFLWQSTAPDSLNNGWHQFVTDSPITVSLAAVADGWTVTTSNNGADFVQPYAAPGPIAYTPLPQNSTIAWAVSPPGSLSITLIGAVQLTAADIAAGSKTFVITIYDDDTLANDPLQTVSLTVPTANGVAGMYTSFQGTATLLNIGHEVAGTLGTCGDDWALVFFKTPDGTNSNEVWVHAE